MQHSVQLQQDYEDTKAEMPWLQLEEENLDEVKSPLPASVKTRKQDLEQPAIVMVNAHTCMQVHIHHTHTVCM